MPAGEIASALRATPSTLLFHLSALERANLVQAIRQRRQITYAVRFDGLRELLSFLTANACGSLAGTLLSGALYEVGGLIGCHRIGDNASFVLAHHAHAADPRPRTIGPGAEAATRIAA
jgi:DNA-binding transcriptional ArsR family regulator